MRSLAGLAGALEGGGHEVVLDGPDLSLPLGPDDDAEAQHLRLSLAVRVGGLGLWDYDIVTGTVVCDDRWHAIMGLTKPVTVYSELAGSIHPDDRHEVLNQDLSAQKRKSASDRGIEFRIVRPDGEVRWVRSAAALLKDGSGNPVRAIGYVVDVTESVVAMMSLMSHNAKLEAENRDLVRQSMIDPLTGIANRRRLDQERERACGHASTTGEPLSIVLLDIDCFKAYNDIYGHQAGDAALASVAETIASAAWRPYDLAARYGGEEFLMILPGTKSPDAVMRRVLQNVSALAIEHKGSAASSCLTVSCGGLWTKDRSAMRPEYLLRRCDKLLYEVKAKGRNDYVSARV